MKEHWNKIYADNPTTRLSWYEAKPAPSLQLIERCAVPMHLPIVDIGSGTTTLISHLITLGFQAIYAIDISDVALEKAKSLLGKNRAAQVHWIEEDITVPSNVLQLRNVAIWHDRAVFHFLTEVQHQQTHLAVLKQVLMPGGHIILATFARHGAPNCSGLPVQRYNVEDLAQFFGDGFSLIESLDYTYQMPSGEARPYVYVRLQKNM